MSYLHEVRVEVNVGADRGGQHRDGQTAVDIAQVSLHRLLPEIE